MFFWELPEKAREIHDRAHQLLEAHQIAPTPLNYELWFFHELGQNDDLRNALDAAVSSGGTLSPGIAARSFSSSPR